MEQVREARRILPHVEWREESGGRPPRALRERMAAWLSLAVRAACRMSWRSFRKRQ